MPGISDFFVELDAAWPGPTNTPVTLKLLGSTALMLQTSYARTTKDSDVLETNELDLALRRELRALAGNGTPMHRRHRVYLDIVAGGLPFLPQRPTWHAVALPGVSLQRIRLVALDVVDVVVSKLARLSDDDLSDIDAMVARELVPHPQLIERFLLALDWCACDGTAYKLPSYLERLHRIERDLFGVAETPIDLSALKY